MRKARERSSAEQTCKVNGKLLSPVEWQKLTEARVCCVCVCVSILMAYTNTMRRNEPDRLHFGPPKFASREGQSLHLYCICIALFCGRSIGFTSSLVLQPDDWPSKWNWRLLEWNLAALVLLYWLEWPNRWLWQTLALILRREANNKQWPLSYCSLCVCRLRSNGRRLLIHPRVSAPD